MVATLLGASGPAASAAPTGDSAKSPVGLSVDPARWDAPHVPGQLLVSVPRGGEARLQGAGMRLIRAIPELGLALVSVPERSSLPQAAALLEAQGVIAWAEPNYTFEPDFTPNDPHYAPYQAAYLSRIEAPAAWDVTTGRSSIVVAILDTGVNLLHEDLAHAAWVNPGEIPGNGVDDDANGFIDDINGWDFAAGDNQITDDHGHGTHVAGIVAARINNGKGIAGLAGNVKIMPVDVFMGGIGAYEDLIRAILYATDNGARVINMSLGASSYSRGEEMAVNYAVDRGVVVVAASGNTGLVQTHYPAAHEAVIAVAATTADDALASYSTRGSWVDVAAPGSSIYSLSAGGGYRFSSGTSMATPHVAALAALIVSYNPLLRPPEVRRMIEEGADDLGPLGRDIYYGVGRINAARSLALAGATVPGRPLDVDPPLCKELLENGGFEAGLAGWQASGDVALDREWIHSGEASAYFPGGVGSRGTLTQTVTIPANAVGGLLWFAYRIDPEDRGYGTTPEAPFDDLFTVWWRTPDGQHLEDLLRSGNTADTVQGGLQWDRYIYRLQAADLQPLIDHGEVALVFEAQNDDDELPTGVWLDSVRFCAAPDLPFKHYLPLFLQ